MSEDAHGSVEESFGDGEVGDAAGVVGGEEAEDPLVGGDERDADHKWKRETEPLDEGGMAEVEDGVVAETFACCSEGAERGGAEDDAGEDANGERVDAEALREKDGSEDDAEVVDEGCDGLVDEDFSDEEFGADDSADEEEELRGKKKPGERGGECGVLRGEAVELPMDVEGSEDFGQSHGRAEDDDHGVEDDGDGAVATLFVACCAIAVEDGDERDGRDSADEEVGEHVGQLEGSVVGVGLRACAEDVIDVFGSDETKDAGEQRRDHDEQRGGVGGVGRGGSEPGEETLAGRWDGLEGRFGRGLRGEFGLEFRYWPGWGYRIGVVVGWQRWGVSLVQAWCSG